MRAISQAGIPVFSDAVGVLDSTIVAESGVGVGTGVNVDVGLEVRVFLGVGAAVGVGVDRGMGIGVGIGVGVGVGSGVGVGVGSGVGGITTETFTMNVTLKPEGPVAVTRKDAAPSSNGVMDRVLSSTTAEAALDSASSAKEKVSESPSGSVK